jgi:hypothetical protein
VRFVHLLPLAPYLISLYHCRSSRTATSFSPSGTWSQSSQRRTTAESLTTRAALWTSTKSCCARSWWVLSIVQRHPRANFSDGDCRSFGQRRRPTSSAAKVGAPLPPALRHRDQPPEKQCPENEDLNRLQIVRFTRPSAQTISFPDFVLTLGSRCIYSRVSCNICNIH